MLLEKIMSAALVARKEKDIIVRDLLVTVIGEAGMVGKSDGNRQTTDAEVLQVLKKFEKGMLENEKIFLERQMPIQLWNVGIELDIIRKFMPQKLTDEQVTIDIREFILNNALVIEQKSMGPLTKGMKAKYGDQFDGQQVSRLFKELL